MLNHAIGRALCRLVGVVLVLAVLPHGANAQMGALKRLKNKVSPDSATKAAAAAAASTASGASGEATRDSATIRDSIAIAAKLAAGDTAKSKRSRLSRVASKAVSASQKLEDVTGVSVKDVALAATGAGVGVIAAKKLGVDPTSLVNSISNRGAGAASQAATGGMPGSSAMSAMSAMSGVTRGAGVAAKTSRMGLPTGLPTGMPTGMPAGMPQLPGAMMGRTSPTGAAYGGFYTEADVRALQAFQEEMVRVTMAASQGDAAAQARLERFQTIAEKYQPEMERLALTGTVADTSTVRKLTQIQIKMMKEWTATASPRAIKTTKTPTPVKSGKP